ncbi:MAG: dTMP kinase [Chloroflexi bacterium]|nr:dTMP kinase [Chloroflexota bacterium]
MNLFLTFEGGEGCGKSTQARALYRRLRKQGVPAILTREPGGTLLGARVRRFLKKEKEADIKPEAELFLFLASRAQLVREVIRPALDNGLVVICDRFAGSTLAYQGYAMGLDIAFIRAANSFATGGLRPDLVILLDIAPELGLRRRLPPDAAPRYDRFDTRELAFHRRVREGYLEMARAEPDRWLVVDAGQPPRDIERAVVDRVRRLIGSRDSQG